MLASRMTMKNAPQSSASAPQRWGFGVAGLIEPPFHCQMGARARSARGLVRLAVLGQPLDRREAGIPLRRDAGHLRGGVAERLGADRVEDLAALPTALDQAGAVEHREVLDDRHAADRQLAG